jgi:uncharacterized protein YbaR (Trm112 family)
MSLDWLETFLPKLRCPNTHEPLRVASVEERQRFGVVAEAALVNQSGTHLYLVEKGIPQLLPGSAIVAH